MGLSPFRPGKKEEIESWANWLEAFLDGGDKKQAVEVSKEEEKRRGNELINILSKLGMATGPENLLIDIGVDLCNKVAEQFNLEEMRGLMVDCRGTAWVIYMNGEAKQILTVPMASFLLDTIKPMLEGVESEG